MRTKLTLVTANGKARFIKLPVGADGKVRCDRNTVLGISRGDCIWSKSGRI